MAKHTKGEMVINGNYIEIIELRGGVKLSHLIGIIESPSYRFPMANRERLILCWNSHDALLAALKANVRTCKHFDGDKLCGKIARHMYDDYDTGTEYFCDEHNTPHFAKNYSGVFKPSEIAKAAIEAEQE